MLSVRTKICRFPSIISKSVFLLRVTFGDPCVFLCPLWFLFAAEKRTQEVFEGIHLHSALSVGATGAIGQGFSTIKPSPGNLNSPVLPFSRYFQALFILLFGRYSHYQWCHLYFSGSVIPGTCCFNSHRNILAVITTAVTEQLFLVKTKNYSIKATLKQPGKVMDNKPKGSGIFSLPCYAPADCWCCCVVNFMGTGWMVWSHCRYCSRTYVPRFGVWKGN